MSVSESDCPSTTCAPGAALKAMRFVLAGEYEAAVSLIESIGVGLYPDLDFALLLCYDELERFEDVLALRDNVQLGFRGTLAVSRALLHLHRSDEAHDLLSAIHPDCAPSDSQMALCVRLKRRAEAERPKPDSSVPTPAGPVSIARSTTAQSGNPLSDHPPKSKPFRWQWYETQNTVCIDIYVKNVENEEVQVELQDRFLRVTIQDRPAVEGQLVGDVEDDVNVRARVKVSITLTKTQSRMWGALFSLDQEQQRARDDSKEQQWLQLEREVVAEDEELAGDTMDVLAKLYQQGDPDRRRAMMKSLIESGGTVLSTNWDKVGSETVRPYEEDPDGISDRFSSGTEASGQ